eukprot:Opistho-1_new@27347
MASASRGMSCPKAVMLPASGVVRPRHMRMVVVLPAPLGPITPRHSPGTMSKHRSLTTVCPPKRLIRCWHSKSGVGMAGIVPAPCRPPGAEGARLQCGPPDRPVFLPPCARSVVSVPPAVALQYLLPKRAINVFAGWCAHSRATWWVHNVIPWFIRRYGVNMADAANPDPKGYATFNEFFTRPLRAGVRPLAPSGFVCPVDGAISQFGTIDPCTLR